jgi:hypothetical protein
MYKTDIIHLLQNNKIDSSKFNIIGSLIIE